MAGNMQIAIKERETAAKWLNMVTEINEEYHVAMKEAGETLVDMQNFADGTLVDDFVNFGTDLLNAAEVTFNGIAEIANTVTTILDTVGNFVESATSFIGNTVGKIFGK